MRVYFVPSPQGINRLGKHPQPWHRVQRVRVCTPPMTRQSYCTSTQRQHHVTIHDVTHTVSSWLLASLNRPGWLCGIELIRNTYQTRRSVGAMLNWKIKGRESRIKNRYKNDICNQRESMLSYADPTCI